MRCVSCSVRARMSELEWDVRIAVTLMQDVLRIDIDSIPTRQMVRTLATVG